MAIIMTSILLPASVIFTAHNSRQKRDVLFYKGERPGKHPLASLITDAFILACN